MRTSSSVIRVVARANGRSECDSVYLDRTEADGRNIHKAEAMGNKAREKDKDASKSDRVTLKKEIGLLTACAIIIGECLIACFLRRAIERLPRRSAWLMG